MYENSKKGDAIMKVAVVGSRGLIVTNLARFLPEGTTEIVSGGARGIDQCARKYAIENNIKLTEFLPDYKKYGRKAPLKRNLEIIDYADVVVAIWDSKSRGTWYVIHNCMLRKKRVIVYEDTKKQ